MSGGDSNDKLFGGSGNDSLSGGSGDDKLYGGDSNDSLYGVKGSATFIYKPGEGTYKIFDFAANDMLTILKSNGSASGSFTKSAFNSGELTLTISGGGTLK